MIDFGFSKRYIDPYTHTHIPDSRAKRDFIGNYWFRLVYNNIVFKILIALCSSVGVHCRGKGDFVLNCITAFVLTVYVVPSRRDDLEAAALMLIHLLTPRGLPWTRNGVPKSDEAHDRLKKEKKAARPEDLCRGLPSEFEEFLRYCRRLQFQECPDYERWREEFKALAVEEGFPESDDFIWPPERTQVRGSHIDFIPFLTCPLDKASLKDWSTSQPCSSAGGDGADSQRSYQHGSRGPRTG